MWHAIVRTYRYVEDEPKPAKLPNTFWGWILPVWRANQEEVIAVAGTDGAVYLMMLKFGTFQINLGSTLASKLQ